MSKQPLYRDWIKEQARIANSDGCTRVLQWRVNCCYEHDLCYAYAKDPRDAYRIWRDLSVAHDPDPQRCWTMAAPITRGEADKLFRKCIQTNSKLGKLSPMAWWRWAGVRVFGRGTWDRRHK